MTTIIDADELASGAYEHDARLKDVVIPDNVTQIGKYAFSLYPAYVFFHTDFSSGRKEMIKRDMAYSSGEAQIREIFAAEIAASVKKGWEEC